MESQMVPGKSLVHSRCLLRVLFSHLSRAHYPLTRGFLLSMGEGRILILSKGEMDMRILRVLLKIGISQTDNKIEFGMLDIYYRSTFS